MTGSLILKIEALAEKIDTDVHTAWAAFELFVEKEIGYVKKEVANDLVPDSAPAATDEPAPAPTPETPA